MKNFFNKQREIIVLLVYAAIIAGLIYLVILPLFSRINGMNDQIQQESMKRESVKLHINELPKIQKQYQTLESSGDLESVLLDKNKAVVLIEKLEKLAEDTNNKITIAVQDNAPAKKAPAKSAASSDDALVAGLPSPDYLQMKITLSGDYNSIVKFIGLLEKFEYYADITAVQINKAETDAMAQSTSNVGMFGTAAASAASTVKKVSKVPASDTLTATLDTAFYTN